MMISQLKWIGLGTAALGLLAATAGISARAVGLRPVIEEGAARAEASKPAETKSDARSQPAPGAVATPAPRGETLPSGDVQSRIADMEQKLDRITRFLDGYMNARFPEDPPRRRDEGAPAPVLPLPAADVPPAAAQEAPSLPSPPIAASPEPPAPIAPPSPALPPQPAEDPPIRDVDPDMPRRPARSGATDAMASLVLAPRDRGSVREIEALLQNLYKRQQRNDALRETGAISADAAVVPTELARVLVARLREMEDEFEASERNTIMLLETGESMKKEIEELESGKEAGADLRQREEIQRKIERLAERMVRLEDEILTKKLETGPAERRSRSAQRLTQWAENHFKELRLED